MIKKITFLLLSALYAVCAKADNDGWYRFPIFADDVSDIVETAGKVYFLSGTQLYSYSADDSELYAYSPLNKLSGSAVSSMFAAPGGDCVALAYADGNIDVLYDDGSCVNLPEIRDAQILGSKAINHIAFGNGRMAVSAAFGLVVYDLDRMEVEDSGVFNANVMSSAVVGENLVVCMRNADGNGYGLYWAPLSGRHNSHARFNTLSNNFACSDMQPCGDASIIIMGLSANELVKFDIDFANNTIMRAAGDSPSAAQPMRPCKDGYYTASDDSLYLFDGAQWSKTALPSSLAGQRIALYSDATKIWCGDEEGVGRYDISASSPVTLHDKMLADNATTCHNIGYLIWSNDRERLYVSNLCASLLRMSRPGERVAYQQTNIIEDGFVRDVSLKEASADHESSIVSQQDNGNRRMYGDSKFIVEDPEDANVYYCANNHEGVYVVRCDPATGKTEEIGKFGLDNSPVADFWGSRVNDVNIDPQGNLWVGFRGGDGYIMLPAEKRRQDPAKIKKSDWKTLDYLRGKEFGHIDMMSLFCPRSGIAFLIDGKYEQGLMAIDTKGTWGDPKDDVCRHITSFTDQDGNVATYTNITFLLEDSRGAVWVGTSSGIFEITDPAKFVSGGSPAIKRLKVPRNDGTNYADYLLDSDQVNWIAEDPAGRKWVATETSGIYLVSREGDEIVKNLTISNSPLPSNQVNAIECDPKSNLVYVGTPHGLYTFLSDASPSADDLDDIVCYPNPVRPEFSGDVTISGLIDNSIVKIADSAGNVIYQTRSEGGMATWPVCNASGARARSGVYYVFVIADDGESKKGNVAKIAVIN